jgi:hypothetical protein
MRYIVIEISIKYENASHIKLTKEFKLLFTVGVIILLYFALPDYYYSGTLNVQAQLQQQPPPIMGIKITSQVVDQVSVGHLTISGISTDNATTDCTVYADWNNTKPFQKALATGPGGANDYSSWTFTYTDKYHLITNGTNDLTSKLSCLNNGGGGGTANLTTYYSLDITGNIESSSERSTSAVVKEQKNNLSSDTVSSSSTLHPIKGDNNNTKTATIIATNPESNPSVPITRSPPSSSAPSIQEQHQQEGKDQVLQKEGEPQLQPTPGDNEDTTIYWDIQ